MVRGPVRVSLAGGLRVNRDALAVMLEDDRCLRVSTLAAEDVPEPDVDVVVVDAGSAGEGLEVVGGLAGTTDAAVLVLGAPDDDRDVIAFAELGVSGFVERDATVDELVSAIVSAAHGELTVPPRIAALLRRGGTGTGSRIPERGADLTTREREVVELIAAGLSNKEIAARLSIGRSTAKNHVHNILGKLQVSSRSEAVAYLRLVDPGDGAHVPRHATRSTAVFRAD